MRGVAFGLKGNGALGGQVSKFGSIGFKKFLDPECVDGNVVIFITTPVKSPPKTGLKLGKNRVGTWFL
jgi:hypothetical protein